MAPAVLTEPPVTRDARPADEEALYEIVDGQPVDLPPRSAYATWIASRLDHRLGPFVEEHGLGTVVTEMLFILDPRRNLRRRPDVAFVSAKRWPVNRALPESGDWDVVPDLAVEVVSPTDEFSDVVAKLREYFEYGVRRVWVILPEQSQVYVYESPTQVRILAAGETLSGGDLFPGFALPLASLFARAATAPSP
ncbi:MAG: Uma2 family endonuclease [Pirellulaceae bacterium]|nr:Uma2 family endonuclease [Pirellulaceae bacterium]